ncbi:MAG: endo-1,4-beta-xylanase [Polyangiaceae bacterium]|nr:endo-1,4-beta-xylanase [Polyangiaceae bacterium]
MFRVFSLALVLVLTGLCCCSTHPTGSSATPSPVAITPSGSPTGTPLLPTPSIDALALQGDGSLARVSTVSVTGQPFDRAIRAESLGGAPETWSVQIGTKLTGSIIYRDVLLVSFYLRAVTPRGETGEAQTELALELAREPWTKIVAQAATAGGEWVRFDIPCEARGSFAAGETQVVLRLGYAPQTIEIGGVEIQNFGRHRLLTDLPRTRLTYRGRDPNASWRAAAADRIEQIRMSNLEITVEDARGAPLEGAKVSLEMTRHAFMFGTAINGRYVAAEGTDPDRARYLAEAAQLFNTVVLENELKWQPLAGDWGDGFSMEVAHEAVRWAKGNGLDVRGHVLVWPGWKNLPARLRRLDGDRERLRKEVRDHVRELAAAMRGELVDWDVINEPWDNHDLLDLVGREEMVTWFRDARAADPDARLFINDYGILSGGGGNSAHRDSYEGYIRYLLEQKAPVGGIGIQGHFGSALTSPGEMLTILDRFGALGPPIVITEYDIVIDDEALAGDFTRDFLTVLFSHPRVEGFLMWGFWDARHWKDNAAMFRRDWSLKPAGKAYQDLVLRDWWTRVEGQSGPGGTFQTRGILGSYRVTAQHGGEKKTAAFELDRSGARVTVRLDPRK